MVGTNVGLTPEEMPPGGAAALEPVPGTETGGAVEPPGRAVRQLRGGFDLHGESTPVRVLVHDVLASRRLLLMLARKDFLVRYRRASFGLVWAVALPLFQAVVMAVVFSHVVKIHTQVNYPTFVYSGILAWTFFNMTVMAASTSIVDGSDIATKVYFPRALLPLVSIGSSVYGFVPGVVILLGFALVSHVHVGLNWLLLLPATAIMVVLTAAFSMVLAALHVYFRDVRYMVTAAMTAWLYLTPVLYPLDRAPGILRRLIEVLPTTGMVELFRAATVGADPGWTAGLVITAVWTVALVAAAALLYRRFDRVFVDPM